MTGAGILFLGFLLGMRHANEADYLEAVNSFSLGVAYILLFGAGSIVGMAVLSLAIAIPLRISAGSLAWLHTGMTAAWAFSAAGSAPSCSIESVSSRVCWSSSRATSMWQQTHITRS